MAKKGNWENYYQMKSIILDYWLTTDNRSDARWQFYHYMRCQVAVLSLHEMPGASFITTWDARWQFYHYMRSQVPVLSHSQFYHCMKCQVPVLSLHEMPGARFIIAWDAKWIINALLFLFDVTIFCVWHAITCR